MSQPTWGLAVEREPSCSGTALPYNHDPQESLEVGTGPRRVCGGTEAFNEEKEVRSTTLESGLAGNQGVST